MNLYEIKKKYPKTWVVIAPEERGENGRVSSWKILNTADEYLAAKALYEQYLDDGCSEVCLYDTSEKGSVEHASDIARFFRVHMAIAE